MRIGSRSRSRRVELGFSIRELAERSELSARFLSDVEGGKTNISITKLAQLADALDLPLTALLQPGGGSPRAAIDRLLADCTGPQLNRAREVLEIALGRATPRIVALMGVRGAGKSSVGVPLARSLGVAFIELVDRIEARAGIPLADIFTLYGEAFYRTLELQCFTEIVVANEPCVLALPGGIVGSDAAVALLRASCTSVWLKATAEAHWNRVFAQGDTRPMEGRSDAMDDLRKLLEARAPLYAASDLTIETAGVPPGAVVEAVLAGLDAAGRTP